MLDIIVAGAGPAGIAVGIAAVRRGLSVLLLDKGAICNTIYRFPERMRFFSTADQLEFAGVPLIVSSDKPAKLEVLNYFTRLALIHRLPVATYEAVEDIRGAAGSFEIATNRRTLHARTVVLATGTYDCPNPLHVPGEDLDHVSHYYLSPQPYVGRKVLIVGGRNSAAEAALELYRAGADVTMLHRGELRESSIKYWVLPDLENRLAEGAIKYFWRSSISRIERERVLIQTWEGERWIDADFVLALTGYHPDWDLLGRVSIDCSGRSGAPAHNPETLESNVPGIYIAGVLTAGADPSKIFIENSRHHGETIVSDISAKLRAAEAVEPL